MSDEDIQSTPPELRELAIGAINNLLPEKSKNIYEKEYEKFMAWCATKNVTIVTENVVIAFFEVMSKQYKSSTLWKIYSMLRSVLNIRQNIDISKYTKLQALLRRCSAGYEPKKSHILEYAHIETFIKEAPDSDYLSIKVVLIMGYSGACRRDELANLSIECIEYKSDSIFVAIPNTKTKTPRLFAITNPAWINLIKKYASLRPSHITHKRFFIYYRQCRCTVQPIGINKIGEMPRIIAKFLQLPDASNFSGHCFRRSSASHLANSGGDLITLKRHGGWKSSAVAEGYVDASKKKKIEVAEILSTNLGPSLGHSVTPGNSRITESSSTAGPSTFQSNERINLTQENSSKENNSGISITAGKNSTISINVYNNCTISKEN